MPLVRIDHVQLAIPPGGEEAARGFYRDLLGMAEVPKPPELARRGGCWFADGPVELHLGVEAEFRPARKAHPALRVADFAELVERLRGAGCAAEEDRQLPGVERVFVADPFGNRIELIKDD